MNLDQLVETIQFIDEAKGKKVDDVKIKKDKPMDQTSHKLKMARGLNRKHLYQVPKYQRLSNEELRFAKNVVKYAKNAKTGVWKLSDAQVEEITAKYKFNRPTLTKRTKHLGSTGILMWLNPKNNHFYLVKLGKSREGMK